MIRKHSFALAALTLASALAVGSAQAATVIKTLVPVVDIPALTGFATTGAMMTGLSIRAVFSGGQDQTRLWATTGANSGGVMGTGWGLSMDGDSFTANIWGFMIDPQANLGMLTRLVIDGTNALTVLDTTNPSPGTPGSAAGRDFSIGDPDFDLLAIANYTNMVSISGADALQDLFQTLTVTFGDHPGPRSNFRFSQDTDNDSRFGKVPEPGSLALAGLALAALGASVRRARKA